MSRQLARLPRRIPSRLYQVLPATRAYATPVEYDPRPKQPDPQLGGYPELPYIPMQARPPKGWTDQQARRNFGETVHEEYDVLDMFSADLPKVHPPTAMKQLGVVALMFIGFGFVIYKLTPESPAVAREYPFGGLIKELGGLEENKAREEPIEEED